MCRRERRKAHRAAAKAHRAAATAQEKEDRLKDRVNSVAQKQVILDRVRDYQRQRLSSDTE